MAGEMQRVNNGSVRGTDNPAIICPKPYPMPGVYLRAVRRAFAITGAGGTVRIDWASPELDAAGWCRETKSRWSSHT